MVKKNKSIKPIIGISMDTGANNSYSKFPWYAVRVNYVNSILNSNGIPLLTMIPIEFPLNSNGIPLNSNGIPLLTITFS